MFTCRYKLAEKLSERLDEMGKDLTSMIEEVNGASATISKTNRADEPVSYCHVIALRPLLTFAIDLSDRSHPELALIPVAGHRPGNLGAASQGCCSPEGRTVNFFAPWLWLW